jgi:hypothetical protein
MSLFRCRTCWPVPRLRTGPGQMFGTDIGKGGKSALATKANAFRDTGLSAPTIEALYRRGLLQELEVHKRLKNPHQNSVQGHAARLGISPVFHFMKAILILHNGSTACQAQPIPV